MVFCAGCGHELSDQAVACPACGRQAAAPATKAGAVAAKPSAWRRFMSTRLPAWVALAALLVGVGIGSSGSTPSSARADAPVETSEPPVDEEPEDEPEDEPEEEEPPAESENPDADYTSNCDYILKFGDYPQPNKHQFIAGADIENTGNVAVRVELRAKWQRLGATPVRETKSTVIPVGQSRSIQVSRKASDGDIDRHQSANGKCSAVVALVDVVS